MYERNLETEMHHQAMAITTLHQRLARLNDALHQSQIKCAEQAQTIRSYDSQLSVETKLRRRWRDLSKHLQKKLDQQGTATKVPPRMQDLTDEQFSEWFMDDDGA